MKILNMATYNKHTKLVAVVAAETFPGCSQSSEPAENLAQIVLSHVA